jgi:uncharacterized cupin superfamily protein
MNSVSDAIGVSLDWSDLPQDQCPAGPFSTGVATLAETWFVDVGVWEHPRGTSTDVERDEVFVVLSGSGRVVLADGSELVLRPGTVGVLTAGTPTTWIIDEPLRKVWITPRAGDDS